MYIGDLPSNCRDGDLEAIFRRYGRIMTISVVDKKEAKFAFIDYFDR